MERRSFLGAVAVAPLAPLTLKESPQGPPIARAPEVVRAVEWYSGKDEDCGFGHNHGLFESTEQLRAMRRKYVAASVRTGELAEGRKIRRVNLEFPGTRFFAADFEWPAEFHPRHALEVPDFEALDEYGFGFTCESYVEKKFYTAREQAIEAVAAFNLEASDRKPYDYWMVCLEIGEDFQRRDLLSIELNGRYGVLQHFPHLAVRVIDPTAAEIARHCVGQDWTWTKGGAA
jgi:hypothetical protein